MTPRLTIVLPLKGRHLFTLRFLWHANRARAPYRFLIADGQVHPGLAEVLEHSARHFPNLDIEYVRYPDDRNFSCYFAKMADALKRVTTSYAMMADNDDFLMISGIERALDFLDANASYVCSGARVAGFSTYSGINNPSAGLRGRLNRLYDYYPAAKDVASSLAADRVREGGLHLWIYYSVTRTEALAKVVREAADIDFSDLLVFEAHHVMRILTIGKAYLDGASIGYLRQFGTSQNTSFKYDWVHHLVRSRFTEDIRALVERIAAAVVAADCIDLAQAKDDIYTVLESKFRRYFWAAYGSRQAIKQIVLTKAPLALRWWQNRPHYFMGLRRRALLRRLSNAGDPRDGVSKFRTELASVEDVLSGPAFADFIQLHTRQLDDFMTRRPPLKSMA